jgi:outer membrane receptor protein involved in Fe transport
MAFGLFQKDPLGDRWITYGQGFRPPSLTDRFCNNAFCYGNPGLRPEQGEQIEIGFSSAPQTTDNPDLQFLYGLSVFQISHHDYFSFTTVGAQTQTINSGRAQIFGAEGFVDLRRGQTLWRFGFSHLDGENLAERRRILLVPDWSGSLRVQRESTHTSTYAQLRYWGSYLDQLDSTSPRQELGNAWFADVGWQWRRDAWALDLSARNLFDQPLERRAGYPDPQRELTLALSHHL